MIYNYTSDGTILISDSAESASNYYSIEADGTILISDSADVLNGYLTYTSSGSLFISGEASSFLKRPFIGSGNISCFGSASSVEKISFISSDGIVINNLTTSPSNFTINFNFDFVFDVYKSLEIEQTFQFDVGQLPLRTFRVVGVEYYNCDNIPFCAIPNGLNRMFQEIVARNLAEVCQFLTDVNWIWPIADIQRSIHPVDSFIAVDSTGIAINGLPVPASNEFVSVPFSQIPECIPFTLVATSPISMGINVGVIELSYYEATGGLSISGSVKLVLNYTASGNLSIYGSFDSLCGAYSYVGSGGIMIDDTALLSLSNYNYESSGNVILDGESVPVSPYYKYQTLGSISVFGNFDVTFKLKFVSSSGISVNGDASYPIKPYASGFVYISNSALCSRKYYNFESTGFITVNGLSDTISPYQSYTPDGSISVDGNVVIGIASFEIPVDASTPVTLSDTASTRDSSGGDFWYTSLLSPISLGGNSDYLVPGYAFDSVGSIYLSGTYDSSLNIDDISMGMATEIDFLEITYTEEFTTDLIAVAQNITTTCANCGPIPDILYIRTNLDQANILSDFLLRNKLEIPKSIQLSYNRITESWQYSMHLRGVGSDNSGVQELWHINFDWSCVSQYGEDSLSSSMWKFGLYVKRINLETNLDSDARLFILFPSEDLCSNFNTLGIDFTFDFHFRPDYVTNQYKINVDTFNYYDEVNIFKGTYWDANNFVCRLLTRDIDLNVNVQDISSLRPNPQTHFYV